MHLLFLWTLCNSYRERSSVVTCCFHAGINFFGGGEFQENRSQAYSLLLSQSTYLELLLELQPPCGLSLPPIWAWQVLLCHLWILLDPCWCSFLLWFPQEMQNILSFKALHDQPPGKHSRACEHTDTSHQTYAAEQWCRSLSVINPEAPLYLPHCLHYIFGRGSL